MIHPLNFNTRQQLNMLNLYRYSFDRVGFVYPKEDSIRFYINSKARSKHDGRKGAYVTTYKSFKNYSAQYKLSITTRPNFRYDLGANDLLILERSSKLKILDNKQQEKGKIIDLDGKNLPRVWPAF